jgi:hypothetical protein
MYQNEGLDVKIAFLVQPLPALSAVQERHGQWKMGNILSLHTGIHCKALRP